jgi:hypothetical protein
MRRYVRKTKQYAIMFDEQSPLTMAEEILTLEPANAIPATLLRR